jgi:hypothetical protein
VEQDKVAFGGGPEHSMSTELWEAHPDALADSDVEEEAAVIRGDDRFPKHNPVAWVEAAIEDAMSVRVRGALPPRATHCPEVDVVSHIVGKQALCDQSRRPFPEVRPIPPTCVLISPDSSKKKGLCREILMEIKQVYPRPTTWDGRERKQDATGSSPD